MMKRIIMASSNKGKIAEAKQILKDYEVLSAKEIGIDIEIEEDKVRHNPYRTALAIFNYIVKELE